MSSPPAVPPAPSDAMAGGGITRIPKSRYDSISSYICNHLGNLDERARTECYNDIEAPYNPEAYQALLDGGVDQVLARHIAHLFCRDPLVVFSGKVELDDSQRTDHFENIQSTNWQTVRWKPPPAKSEKHIGWRTEFRSMEVQLTDFENAAFTVFVVLISRVILYFDLDLYIPLSKVDENMERAHKRNALHTERFFFRQSLMPERSRGGCGGGGGGGGGCGCGCGGRGGVLLHIQLFTTHSTFYYTFNFLLQVQDFATHAFFLLHIQPFTSH